MKFYPLLLLISLFGCGPKYSETLYYEEDEKGYECIIYTPKEPIGYLLYLTDSNEVLSGPNPFMMEMLDRHYSVIVPQKWGDNGRSLKVLDSFDNRFLGVSYPVSDILADTTKQFIILAEGFYTPIALKMSTGFKPDELWMIEPFGQELYKSTTEIILASVDDNSVQDIWNLESLDEVTAMNDLMTSRIQQPERFFGPHYSTFLRSYWMLGDGMQQFSQLDSTNVRLIFHSDYPFHSPFNLEIWNERIVPETIPEELDTANYQLRKLEMLFLED